MKGLKLRVQFGVRGSSFCLFRVLSSRQRAARRRRRRASSAKFEQRRQEIAARVDGVVGYAIVDLTTGERIGHLENETFPTASAIKLAIVYELFKQAEEKKIDLDEKVTLDRQPGGRRHRRARRDGHADAVDPRLRGADGHAQRQHRDQRPDRSPRHGPDRRAHAGARPDRDEAAPPHDGHRGGAARRRERLHAGRARAAAEGDERRRCRRRSSS